MISHLQVFGCKEVYVIDRINSITIFNMKIYNNFRNYLTGIISTNLKHKISCIEKQPTQLIP